jgi:pimeloyl-ACP methyl ester carboxylesterase
VSRHRLVQTPDGRALAVCEAGDARGAPVFTLHGAPGAGLIYAAHANLAEAGGVRLIGYDRPGYGRSTPHPGRTVADGAKDVLVIANSLELDRFAVWGISGGAPHALACAALAGDRIVAAASLAGPAPYGAEGLDWLAGMGESNLEEFGAAVAGRDALRPLLEREAAILRAVAPAELVSAWRTLLTPVDAAVLNEAFAGYLVECFGTRLGERVDGWLDDDQAFVRPWGFELEDIDTPVLLWHGRHDRFVPPAHGDWLARRIPGAEARLTEDDGHLTLIERRIGDVHAWLLERL